MSNSVITKIVYVDDDDNVCLCDEQFYKTCRVRVINELPCKKCNVVIHACVVDSKETNNEVLLFEKPQQFNDTLEHLGRLS